MKACGCVPTVAVSGADALEKLRATAPRAPYRLVLADAQMPEMDGFELARIITADPALKNAAVIILSSIGVGVAERVRDCGAAAYVTKPIRRSDLFEAVVEAQAPSPVRERSAAEDEPEYHTRCLQVLLAEDNPVNQKVAVRMLGKGGHTVHVVTTGAQAIRALQSDRYDLVLMDVQMPEMDGLEATRRIREDARFVDIPIVALTAHAMQGDRDGCLAAGMNDYLSKPFNQQELLAKLREWDGSLGRDTAPEAPAQTGEPTCPAGVLDMDALVAVVEGDAEFAQSLISDFLAYTQEQLEKMDDAIAANDAQALGDLAHSIKGAAASLTADRVREAASRIEAMAHDGGHAGLPELVALLKAEADSLRQCADDNLAPSAPRRVT